MRKRVPGSGIPGNQGITTLIIATSHGHGIGYADHERKKTWFVSHGSAANLHDKEAEAVMEHAENEQQTEEEQLFLAGQGLYVLVPQQQLADAGSGQQPTVFEGDEAPAVPMSSVPMNVEVQVVQCLVLALVEAMLMTQVMQCQ